MDIVKKKISFDFDNTLELEWIQETLFIPLSQIYEILIITTRSSERENRVVWEVVKKLNIPEKNVYFTNHELKSEFVDKLGCIMHFDDDIVDVHHINTECVCKAVLIDYKINNVNR